MKPSAGNDQGPLDGRGLPDLEDLAAYLDGMLPEDRRADVEARLAEDAEYYEIFLETVRFREEGLGESEVVSEKVDVDPQPLVAARSPQAAFRRWSAPLALAAGLLLVFLWKPWDPPLGEQFPPGLGQAKLGQLGMHLRGWDVQRGGQTSEAEDRAVAFRAGAYWVHLELAVKYQDREIALRALRDLERALNRRTWPLLKLNAPIKGLEEALELESVRWRDVSSRTKRLMQSLDSVMERSIPERDALEWGRWSEHVLLLYLEERQHLLEERLGEPPQVFEDVEEVSEALQRMRDAPKTTPSEAFEETPFLEAHRALEKTLGD